MKTIHALLIAAAFLLISPPVSADDSSYLILPFNAPEDSAVFAQNFMQSLHKNASFKIAQPSADIPSIYIFPENDQNQDAIDAAAVLGEKSNADFVILGRITKKDLYYYIDAKIISSDDRKTVYSTTLPVKIADTDYDAAFDICGRIKYFIEGKQYKIENLAATSGIPSPYTRITWDAVKDSSLYGIFSSTVSENGPFTIAGTSPKNEFNDTGAVHGKKTWYAVSPIVNGITTDQSSAVAGYRKPLIPKDENLKKLLQSFNKPKPKMNAEEAKAAAEHFKIITPMFQNPTKLNLILFMAKDYIEKKELFTYKSSDDYTITTSPRAIIIRPADRSYIIYFYNNTFFTKIHATNDEKLIDHLVKNAVFFCVPDGEEEVVAPTGEVTYIPKMEAISMCTQYYKEYREWNSQIMIFGTANKNLKMKMEDAQKQFGEQN